ncbi:hypothetical protein DdX_18476 [Ditylenchus destructor]|uniref:Uncharacterized protein n=1 Tax=Ditylenchus destructor TaxID=166010 RepID=A0AAD4MQ05_9BILA|nr:hypothetical protein DdX_18476 [Ditylenchus destructor]
MNVWIFCLSVVILRSTFVSSDLPWWSSLKSNSGTKTKAVILTVLNNVERLSEYKLALETVNCYANVRGYSHSVIILEDTEQSKNVHMDQEASVILPSVHNLSAKCNQKDFFFRRHCVVALYMEENIEKFNLVLFMDSDVGVVNPNHLIHEYLPTNEIVDMVFYNRLFIHEIAAGGFLARNTNYSRQFLHYWANAQPGLPKGFVKTDNTTIHVVFMEKFARPADRRKCDYYTRNWYEYFDYEACVRNYFGLNQTLYTEYDIQGQVRGRVYVTPFGKSWVRDSGLTQSRFSEDDFMFHQWKESLMGLPNPDWPITEWEYPFRVKEFNMQTCLAGNSEPWAPKEGLFLARNQIKIELAAKIKQLEEYYQSFINKMKNNNATTMSTIALPELLTTTTPMEGLIETRKAINDQNRYHGSDFSHDSFSNKGSLKSDADQPNSFKNDKDNGEKILTISGIPMMSMFPMPVAIVIVVIGICLLISKVILLVSRKSKKYFYSKLFSDITVV